MVCVSSQVQQQQVSTEVWLRHHQMLCVCYPVQAPAKRASHTSRCCRHAADTMMVCLLHTVQPTVIVPALISLIQPRDVYFCHLVSTVDSDSTVLLHDTPGRGLRGPSSSLGRADCQLPGDGTCTQALSLCVCRLRKAAATGCSGDSAATDYRGESAGLPVRLPMLRHWPVALAFERPR